MTYPKHWYGSGPHTHQCLLATTQRRLWINTGIKRVSTEFFMPDSSTNLAAGMALPSPFKHADRDALLKRYRSPVYINAPVVSFRTKQVSEGQRWG